MSLFPSNKVFFVYDVRTRQHVLIGRHATLSAAQANVADRCRAGVLERHFRVRPGTITPAGEVDSVGPAVWPFFTDDGYLEHPQPIGAAADESTYLRDHPLVEVMTGPCVLDDNKQDLEATIGRRTVRYFAFSKIRDDEGHHLSELHNQACFVCGTVFQPQTNTSRLHDLDVITEPWGGREVCGHADAAWGTVRHPDVWLRVFLPSAISALLTIDGQKRRVAFVARAHNDSSAVDRWHVVVYGERGSVILLRGTALDLRGRHTRNGLALSKERLTKLASELPLQVAAFASALRLMAESFVDADEVLRLALVIANGGSEEMDVDDKPERVWNLALRIFAMVTDTTGARDDGVPRSPLADEGLYTLAAIFEAAAATEQPLAWHRQLARLLDGKSNADVALSVLRHGFPRVTPEDRMPAHYAARLQAAENLPPLDPVPTGYEIPFDVTDLRRTWCTTLADDDVQADERIHLLGGITDPLAVLHLVAPYVPVKGPPPPPPPPKEKLGVLVDDDVPLSAIEAACRGVSL